MHLSAKQLHDQGGQVLPAVHEGTLPVSEVYFFLSKFGLFSFLCADIWESGITLEMEEDYIVVWGIFFWRNLSYK